MNNLEMNRDEETLAAATCDKDIFPAQISLAMAYVPMQRFENLYDDEKGFEAGTVFAALDKPFFGAKTGGRR